MKNTNSQLMIDPLFVGATRPPMRWGVTYTALLFNLVLTLELFLCTKNLLALLCCLPMHALFALLCARDPRFFDLALLWGRTRFAAAFGNLRVWKASSYSPLEMDVPSRHRFRRQCLSSLEVARPVSSVSGRSLRN